MHIGVTVFNFEDGGLLPGGGYDFAPGIRAIAADPVYTDLVILLEANQYGRDGETALHGFVNALSEAARVPLVGRLGELDRGDFAPALIWNPNSVVIEKWFGYGVHRIAEQRVNYCEARVRDGKPFGVLLQHWDDQCGGLRFTSAQQISWVAEEKIPVLVAGDFNCTASGAHEPERDFSLTPRSSRYHKGKWVHGDKSPVGPETEALDYLLGWWDSEDDERFGGIGMYDLGEMAALRYGEWDALLPTTN
ncbi:hypothetical protein [Haloechinothrix salitolerans]|uniref:Endonuclease/exonuclease/phosphatase domain-containing protein n=1 Tax=Haloechinothrix salitolerans TaxID=926830 RepID=A0ABW2BX91_9PSEU